MLEYTLSDQTEMPEAGGFSVKIIGIGGAGANVLDRMALEGAENTDLLTLNTDVRALSTSVSNNKVQLGRDLLKGMGAGGDPELGRLAALEVEEEIRTAVRGHSMIFVCVGLGGGTGSGAAPEVCRIAKEEGVFLVVFATLPFEFEGKRRMEQAQDALKRIGQQANAVVAFENDLMGSLIVPKDGIQSAFAAADKTISQSVRATIDIVTQPGIIRIGMDELLSALRGRDSRCLFGHGQAKGDNRAQEAVAQALKSPLLDKGKLLNESRNVLVHVAGGESMTLFEVDLLMKEITKHVSDQTQILFGVGTDDKLGGSLAVTVISSRSAGGGGGQPPGGDGKRKTESAAQTEGEALETASSELGAAPVTAGGAASLEQPAEFAQDGVSGATLLPTEPVPGLEPTEPVPGLEPTEPVEGLASTEPVAPSEVLQPPPREPGQVMVPVPGVGPPVAAPSTRAGEGPLADDPEGWDQAAEAEAESEDEEEDRNFAPNYPTPAVDDVAPPDLPEEEDEFAASAEAEVAQESGDLTELAEDAVGQDFSEEGVEGDDIDILASHGHGTIGALLRQQGGESADASAGESEGLLDEVGAGTENDFQSEAETAFDSPFELVEDDEEDEAGEWQGEAALAADDLTLQEETETAPLDSETEESAPASEEAPAEAAQPRWIDEILGTAPSVAADPPAPIEAAEAVPEAIEEAPEAIEEEPGAIEEEPEAIEEAPEAIEEEPEAIEEAPEAIEEEPEAIEEEPEAIEEEPEAIEEEPEAIEEEPEAIEEEPEAIEEAVAAEDEERVEVALDGDLEIEEEVPVEVPESIEDEPVMGGDEAFAEDETDGGFELETGDDEGVTEDSDVAGEGDSEVAEPEEEVIDRDDLMVPESAAERDEGSSVPTISIKDLARRQEGLADEAVEPIVESELAADGSELEATLPDSGDAEEASSDAVPVAEASMADDRPDDWVAGEPAAEGEDAFVEARVESDEALTDEAAAENAPEEAPVAPVLPPGEGEMIVAATETAQPIALFRVSNDDPAAAEGTPGAPLLSPAAETGGNGAPAGSTGPIAPMLFQSDKAPPAAAGESGGQGMLRLEPASQGRFAKTEPTIVDGQDLDVPTYLRRRQSSGSDS